MDQLFYSCASNVAGVVKQTGQVRWNAGSIGGPPPHESLGFGFFMQTMGGIGVSIACRYVAFMNSMFVMDQSA